MPKFRDSKRLPLAAGEDGSRGFFIKTVVSPSSLVKGTARKHLTRQLMLPSNKENMPPVWAVRATPLKRKSPLPVWYPRTPLRDITAIAKAIQRSRLKIATQQQSPRSEQSPYSVNLTTTPQAEQDLPLSTEASLAAASCSGSSEIEKVGSPADILAVDDPTVLSSPVESSTKTSYKPTDPSVADIVEKKLSSSIEQIEKLVKNLKKTPKAAQRSKRATQRRTLMSLR